MNQAIRTAGVKRRRGALARVGHNLYKYRLLYLMLVPTIAVLAVFNYYPLWGLRISLYNYIPWQGFAGSKYVGLQNFRTLFSLPDFPRLVNNTIVINLLKILFGFPAPILFALLLNEVRSKAFKRTVQTISYLPHFVSWIIVSAILYSLINGSYGLVNSMLKGFGIKPPVWYTRPDLWRGILVGTDFNPGIRGVGGKTALKIVRKGEFASVIAEKQPDFDPDPIREFFLDPPVTDDYTLEWRPPDVEGVVSMLCGRYDFSEDRVRSALARAPAKGTQKTLDAWF